MRACKVYMAMACFTHLWCFAIFGIIRTICKNVKNTYGGVLLLVKLQASACNFTKVTLLHGFFSRFLNCAHGTKSRKAPHLEMKSLRITLLAYFFKLFNVIFFKKNLTVWLLNVNHRQHICKLFLVFAQFPFTKSESELDYYYQKVNVRI